MKSRGGIILLTPDQKKHCAICCHTDPEKRYKSRELETCMIYPKKGRTVQIKLCDAHSTELFLKGQSTFAKKYSPVFADIIDTYYEDFVNTMIDIAYGRIL